MISLEEKTRLQKCEKKCGVSFRKKSLLLAALAHPSYRNEHSRFDLEDFERMEFFGDAILNFVVSERLYKRYPKGTEGHLSQLRATLVSKKLLTQVAAKLELSQWILLGKSEQKRPRNEKSKILSDGLESLIAAVFFDRGLTQAKNFILKHFGNYFDSRYLKRVGSSPKNLLQEWVQKKFQVLPKYRFELKNHRFLAWAEVIGRGSAKGEGRSKKEAEQKAARILLRVLKKKEK